MYNLTRIQHSDHPRITLIDQALSTPLDLNSWVAQMRGMTGQKFRQFLNTLTRSMNPCRYLEIGTWQGSSLCAAIADNAHIEAIAVDNYSYGGATEQQVWNNIHRVRKNSAQITLKNQNFEDFTFEGLGHWDIYYYDGGHTEQDHYDSIYRALPIIKRGTVIIIDDWNEYANELSPVRQGTIRAIKDTGLSIAAEWQIDTGENPATPSDWHNGVKIYLVDQTPL